MCVFKEKDYDNLLKWGNLKAKEHWMASYSKALYPQPQQKEKEKMKEFLKIKYVEKRFMRQEEDDEDSKSSDSSDESPEKQSKTKFKKNKKSNKKIEKEIQEEKS